ncbi:MAG: hypothetical protein PHT37_05590 [Candidatus Cloacimonetes bacterium]|jgi:hypothetical protein|nr:hypothetical protein [Candidatus Cloacimonadota bacterium]MDD4277340.1 hypothetical protein [Candidatus Cloacimonadota bacterium]
MAVELLMMWKGGLGPKKAEQALKEGAGPLLCRRGRLQSNTPPLKDYKQ